MDTPNPTGDTAETQTVAETPVADEASPVTWENAFETAFESKSEEEATPEAVAETEAKDPEAPFPAEEEAKTEDAQPEAVAETETEETEPEEEPALEEVTASAEMPPISRKRLGEIKKAVIDPFRNPNVPISEAREAFRQFHPTRTEELEQAIVNESAKNFPNEWLQALTGVEGLTVERVKEMQSIVANLPAKQIDDSQDIPEYLTDLYGETWKDAANDASLHEDDAKLAKLYRRSLDLEERHREGESQLKTELEKARKELDELKPQIDEIKKAQEKETEVAVQNAYDQMVTEYRGSVEKRVLPKLFADNGLDPIEADTEAVRGMKDAVRAYFEPLYGQPSDFELYFNHEFASREAVEKIAHRVSSHLSQAARLSADKAPEAKAKADALRQQAKMEQDALAVLTRKAAQDFLQLPRVKSQMALLEEIAQLRKQMAGRPEIIGQSASAMNGDAWLEEAKEKGNIWDSETIGNRLSMAR